MTTAGALILFPFREHLTRIFLSNPDEEQLLLNDDYQNKLAWGIYNGIINYFYN